MLSEEKSKEKLKVGIDWGSAKEVVVKGITISSVDEVGEPLEVPELDQDKPSQR